MIILLQFNIGWLSFINFVLFFTNDLKILFVVCLYLKLKKRDISGYIKNVMIGK